MSLMKRYINNTLAFIAICFAVSSCLQSFDDIKPTNKVSVEDVWSDPDAVTGILAHMYNSLIFEDFSYFWGDYSWRSMDLVTMSDEGTAGFQKEPCFDQEGATWEYPDEFLGNFIYIQGNQGGENIIRSVYRECYVLIRRCNEFLEQLKTATLDEDDIDAVKGEAKFLRAMAYFTLVKRYGGVPLITEAKEFTGDIESLQEPRATERAIWDFIIAEADEAAGLLPLTRSTGVFRATSGAALALESRAALYAGSIAKYGTVGFGNLTGIQKDAAKDYFATAYRASQEVINLPYYSLFNSIPDKTENYRKLFVTKNNGEYIFQKSFDVASDIGNSYDKKHLPYSLCRWGAITPTFEMAEAYEFLDGTPGSFDTENQYDDINTIYQGRDPRMIASLYVPGQEVKDTTYQFQRGLIKSDGSFYIAQSAPGPTYADEFYTDSGTGKTYRIFGKDGGAYTGDASKTGFNVRKFVDEDCETVAQWEFGKTETPWPIFRLGEMYLNLAEAAVEMGEHTGEALDAVNKIRSRAGMPALSSIDIDKVRHERRVELAFENLRFWDLKRWRIAHLDASRGGLNGFRGRALHPYYDVRTDKWQFVIADDIPKRRRIFTEKNYYTKFSNSIINANPQIIQNPGYIN